MRYFLGCLLLVSACHSSPTAPACARPPADTTTVSYNGARIYLNACP